MGKAIFITAILLVIAIASTFFLLTNSNNRDNQTSSISQQTSKPDLTGKWESIEGYSINLETNEFEQINYDNSKLEIEIYPNNKICTAKVINSDECQYSLADYQSNENTIYIYQPESYKTIIYKIVYLINNNQLEWNRQDKDPTTDEWTDSSKNIFVRS